MKTETCNPFTSLPIVYTRRSFLPIKVVLEPLAREEWEVSSYNPGASKPERVWPRFVGRTAEGDAMALRDKLIAQCKKDGWVKSIRIRKIAGEIKDNNHADFCGL